MEVEVEAHRLMPVKKKKKRSMVLSVRFAEFSTFISFNVELVEELRKATKVIDTRQNSRVPQSQGATRSTALVHGQMVFGTDCASIGDQFNRECVLSVCTRTRHEIKEAARGNEDKIICVEKHFGRCCCRWIIKRAFASYQESHRRRSRWNKRGWRLIQIVICFSLSSHGWVVTEFLIFQQRVNF